MNRKFAVAYVVFIHLFLGLVLLKSNFIQRAEYKIGFPRYEKNVETEITKHYRDMLSYHSRMDGNVPNGSVVFIGDSIVQGLCVSAVVPSSVNYGIGGDTTVGVLKRLPIYRSINMASAVVIAVGLNDMKFRSNDDIIFNYAAMIEQIPRNVPVIFSAVLPVNDTLQAEWKEKNKDRIKTLNSKLKKLTEKSENLFFIDAGNFFVDSRGNIVNDLYDGDGLHLNSRGNAIWIHHLQETIIKARQSFAPSNKCTLSH